MNTETQQTPAGLFRRKFPRRVFTKGVGFLLAGLYQVGQGLEIGEGGLSLMLPDQHGLDSEIALSFQIPNGSFVVIRAEIKTCRANAAGKGYIHGCAFKGLIFDRKREIRSYVSARDN